MSDPKRSLGTIDGIAHAPIFYSPNIRLNMKSSMAFGKVFQLPKSSPNRIAAKKARESPPPRLSFSVRLLRIHALIVKKHHNPLIWRHLPNAAFYSTVFQNALAGAP